MVTRVVASLVLALLAVPIGPTISVLAAGPATKSQENTILATPTLIREIQFMLLTVGIDPGPIDGNAQQRTKRAALIFQERNGLGAFVLEQQRPRDETGGDTAQRPEVPDWKETLAQYDADHDGRISLAESPMKNPTTFMEADLNHDGYLDERDWNFYRARKTSQNNVVAIRGGGHGDVTSTHVLWRYRKAVPNVPSPLLYKGVMYLMKEGGIFTSVNPKNGEIYKQARLTGALGQYWSSPVATDGKIYVASEDGKVTVISAGEEWEIIAINEFDEDIFATPAIAGESIYIRTRGTLYRFGR